MKRRDAMQLGGAALLSGFAPPPSAVSAASLAAETAPLSYPPVGSGLPAIAFTQVPAYGTSGLLRGRVENVDPSAYLVCVYIRVEGVWFSKPTYDNPCVPINQDGTWEANINTGGDNDTRALEIAAFLVPISKVGGSLVSREACRLPAELALQRYAKAVVDRLAMRRPIEFSAFEWSVKDLRWGPHDNVFSAHPDNVSVDRQGQLHLKITNRGGEWQSAEVIAKKAFGYGSYIYYLSSRVDLLNELNENAVLGLFTWDMNACHSNNGEVDIEFSRWGDRASPLNAQYVVQPFATPGNRHQFHLDLPVEASTHVIDWRREGIQFRSLRGHQAQSNTSSDVLHQWTYSGPNLPEPGTGSPRINLWLFNRRPPSDGKEIEVVVNAFDFSV